MIELEAAGKWPDEAWLDWVASVLAQFTQISTGLFMTRMSSKQDAMNLVLGPIQYDPGQTLSETIVRWCDSEVVRCLAEQPIPVAELLLTGACSKTCLLALSIEARECACPCAGRYHAALASAEVGPR